MIKKLVSVLFVALAWPSSAQDIVFDIPAQVHVVTIEDGQVVPFSITGNFYMSTAATPKITGSIAQGEPLSGNMTWTAMRTNTSNPVVFTIDGGSSWTESVAPFEYGGIAKGLDTTKFANGDHTFKVQAGTAVHQVIAKINNSVAPPLPPPPPTAGVVATVKSPFLVTSNPYNQDTEYRVTSSLRQANAVNPLPFDMPARATLAASPKKAYGHYFPQFPISVDNADPANDYYATQWLRNTGESNKHVAYGGMIRDRPPGRAPRSGDWALADCVDECRWARDAGIDGFLVDTLSWTIGSPNYNRGRKIFDGAKALNDSTFKVAYMIDTDIVSGTDFTTASDRIKDAHNSGAYLMVNGKPLVASFRPEGNSAPNYWTGIEARLRTVHGLQGMAFVPCYSSNWNAHPAYDSFTHCMSIWTIGNNPGVNSIYWVNDAKSVGKLFMQPIAFGDSRPRNGIFDEQQGMLTLRDQWLTAIANNVDWVQYRTWSDFAEGAQMIPSRNHGYCYLDVSAYYLSRWKTGTYPTIQRDCIYLSHRICNWDVRSTQVGQSIWQVPRNPTAHPGKNVVDVMTFLVAPAEVTVKIGTTTQVYTAPAGVFNKQFPLTNGQILATAKR